MRKKSWTVNADIGIVVSRPTECCKMKEAKCVCLCGGCGGKRISDDGWVKKVSAFIFHLIPLCPASNTEHPRGATVSVTFSRLVTSLKLGLVAGCRFHSSAQLLHHARVAVLLSAEKKSPYISLQCSFRSLRVILLDLTFSVWRFKSAAGDGDSHIDNVCLPDVIINAQKDTNQSKTVR